MKNKSISLKNRGLTEDILSKLVIEYDESSQSSILGTVYMSKRRLLVIQSKVWNGQPLFFNDIDLFFIYLFLILLLVNYYVSRQDSTITCKFTASINSIAGASHPFVRLSSYPYIYTLTRYIRQGYHSPLKVYTTKIEYDELKAEYKATRRNCKSREERKTLMRLYVDDLIEIAVQARIAGDVDFNANLNQEIKALNRRIFTGQNNSW